MRISEIIRKYFATAGLALGISAACLGCGGWNVPPNANELKDPMPANAATLADARATYVQYCEKCHGVNGDGKKPPGSMYSYNTPPTNFTNARLMDRMSDGEIYWKMTNGRKPMPLFKNRLTDEQRWELVDLLRNFAHPANPSAEK